MVLVRLALSCLRRGAKFLLSRWNRSVLALDVAACLAALFQVALVVFFSAPEGLGGLDLRHNSLRFEAALGGELGDFGTRLRFLLGRVKKDGGTVLCAPVRALAVEGGGVVEGKERIQQLFVRDNRRIEFEFDHLCVAGLVGADVFVGGSFKLAAFIAHGSGGDAGNGGKGGFNSPKTASAECCFFYAHDSSDAANERRFQV